MIGWIVGGVFAVALGVYVFYIVKTFIKDFKKITSHGEW